MKKIVYIIFCIAIIAVTACHSGHQTPSNPNNTENRDDSNKPKEGDKENPKEDDNDKPNEGDDEKPKEDDNDKPNEGDNEKPKEDDNDKPNEGDNENPKEDDNDKPNEGDSKRPSDFDIARRLYAQWISPEDIYEVMTLNLDPLFINGMDASFSVKSLAKYVSFRATDVSGTNIYTLTDEDLDLLQLSNFKYDSGIITFKAKFATQNFEKDLNLNFSREKYLLARIKPKKKINLYMQGVNEFPSLFVAELFDYDENRYDLIPKSCSKVGNSLSMTVAVLPHNLDGEMATIAYTLDGFKSLDELAKELTIGAGSGFAESFYKFYRGSRADLNILNRYAEKWSQYLQFSVKYGHEEIELVWGYTHSQNKQKVLEPDSAQKRYKDIYLIEPKFVVEEVKELGDFLDIKVRLANANETEIKNAIYTVRITIPKS
ncbi:hypothetical protein QYZ87_10150 [Porphyromonadaceae bacterium W3.11]|nr:hypothetical protein [Porphyromonadaceae bacterium W3.11]